MANKIKETPILIGNDAKRFLNQKPKKVSFKEREIMFSNYEKLKSIFRQ